MSGTLAGAFWRNFLGHAPDWYKWLIVGCLVANPLLLALAGPVVTSWAMLFEFIVTLMMALRCYPLQPGGLLAVEAVLIGLTTPESVYEEVVQAFPVILLLMFMVAGIYFLRDLLLGSEPKERGQRRAALRKMIEAGWVESAPEVAEGPWRARLVTEHGHEVDVWTPTSDGTYNSAPYNLREIIVYGDRGLPSTYFAQVTLRYFGATNAKVFHDGIEGWRTAGQPVATTPSTARPIAVKLTPVPGVISESREVVAALKRADVQFLDVRTAREFRGEDIRAIRGGHIPGAINIPFEQNWVDPDTRSKLRSGAVKDTSGMSLKPREQLLKLYENLDPNKEVHVYCQSGNRASQTAVVLQDLGFKNVKVYDASWLGYSSWLTAPAESEVWTNFGSLPAAMRAIENRFGELEKQRAAR